LLDAANKSAWLAALVLATCSLAGHPESDKNLPRIGYLANGTSAEGNVTFEAFREGLRALGHVEGRTVVVDARWAERHVERLPRLAAELIDGGKADVMLIPGCGKYGIEAVRNVSRTIPLVIAVCGDLPGFIGEVKTFASPGGNTTGLTFLAPELSAKRLETLKAVAPRISRVAVVWNRESAGWEPYWRELHLAASKLNIVLHSVEFQRSKDLDAVFSEIERGRAEALLTLTDTVLNFERSRVVAFAARRKLPAVYDFLIYVEDGGLAAYAPDLRDLFRRAALQVDKILKGARPGEIPIERPTKFEFHLNLKAAQELGLDVPPSVVLRADKVIR
jgi:putative ABC transport system substrate-binding protein